MIVVGDFKEAYLNVKAKVLPSGVKTRLSILRDQSFLISRRRKGGGWGRGRSEDFTTQFT